MVGVVGAPAAGFAVDEARDVGKQVGRGVVKDDLSAELLAFAGKDGAVGIGHGVGKEFGVKVEEARLGAGCAGHPVFEALD